MNYFFIDAETDGLYGQFLSVAILVTNPKGEELDRFYGALDINPSYVCSEWVKENVLPHLINAESTYKNENELKEAVWQFWLKHRESSYAVADIMHPVESRLFTECVMRDLKRREFLAPFPLLDLSTLLVTNGIPFDFDRQSLSCLNIVSHDAMNDVKMMAAIWVKLLSY